MSMSETSETRGNQRQKDIHFFGINGILRIRDLQASSQQ